MYRERRFIVSCMPFFDHECETRYAIRDGLAVRYKYSDLMVAPEHFAKFDLMVRALIETRRRPALDWGRPLRVTDYWII